MARVQVSDEAWASFRAGLGATPVNVALGELVEREVGRQRRRSAGDVEGARLALEDARSVAEELAALVARLERIAGVYDEAVCSGSPVRQSAADRAGAQSPLEGP